MVPHRALKAKIAENCKKNPIFEATTIAMIAITKAIQKSKFPLHLILLFYR